MRAGALGLALAFALAAPAGAADPVETPVEASAASRGGTLWLRPNPDALKALGVRRAKAWPGNTEWALTLAPREPVRVELGDGAPTKLLSGSLWLDGFSLLRADGRRTPALRLEPAPRGALDWHAVDAQGAAWFTISHGMRSPDVASHGLALFTADVRSGPALVAWAGQGDAGQLIANARLQLPMAAPALPKADVMAKSCAAPNWPGTPGFVTDVMLRSIDTVDVLRCRQVSGGGACDGPGGVEGEMVIVPSATLRNSTALNASEVPWYTKFQSGHPFEPYGNDQHPYLVWNLYRLAADGTIEQVSRSGLKHAFATSNEQCSEPCFNSHILGRGCQDLYDAGSNDFGFALSPRSEVIPARGVWGRCFSVYDDTLASTGNVQPGCDGQQDSPPNDDFYRHRLAVRESDVDAALNPGATYLIDAWYVVRDDRAIYNTMGSRSLAPQFGGASWTPGALGPFVQGAVIDRWLAAAPAGSRVHRAELSTAEGTVVIATRVRQLPDLRWRYDYAVMNFDFSRAATEGSEPNLRVLRNQGLNAVVFPLANGATVDASQFLDGDQTAFNDWTLTSQPASIGWSTGVSTLDWGRLVSFSLTSASAPGVGAVQLSVAEAGSPAAYTLAAPVPDAVALFGSGFE